MIRGASQSTAGFLTVVFQLTLEKAGGSREARYQGKLLRGEEVGKRDLLPKSLAETSRSPPVLIHSPAASSPGTPNVRVAWQTQHKRYYAGTVSSPSAWRILLMDKCPWVVDCNKRSHKTHSARFDIGFLLVTWWKKWMKQNTFLY